MKPICILLAFAPACAANGTSMGDDDNQQTADIAQWNQLSSQYDQRRADFLGTDVQELAAVGNQLFWLDTTSFDPKLDRYDDSSAAKLAYTFSIGTGDTY